MRRQTFLIFGAVGLVVFLAYANTLHVPFLFDDQESIVENQTIRKLSWAALAPPHGEGLTVEGRPMLNFSLALNYAWSGADVWSYHTVNIAIHLFAALSLFGLVRRTLRRAIFDVSISNHSTEIALAAALFWALHPLQTESVTYVVQRAESLMGLFYLLTLYGFVRGCEAENARGWFALSVASCTFGMATKEVMVSAPLLVLLYDRTFVAGSFRGAWRQRQTVYLGLAASWLLLGYLVLGTGSRGGTIGPSSGVTWWQFAFCQARAIDHYIGLALWPCPLIFDYGSDFVTFTEMVPYAALDFVLLGLVAVSLWRRPALGFLGAWFYVILAPTSSVVGGTRQMVVEHRVYLSLAAIAVLAAIIIRVGLARWGWVAWLTLAVLLGILTVQRNWDYRSALSIYSDTVAKRPENAHAHNNLGQALLLAGRLPEAVAQFTLALQNSPARAVAHSHLAGALYKLGRVQESVEHAQAALTLNPNYAEAHYNLGTGLLRLGHSAGAIEQYEIAVRLRSNYPEAYNNLGAALVQSGRPADAIQNYEEALRLKPDYIEAHYNLAVARQELGQFSAAIEHYEIALRLRPNFAEAHNNLGVTLMGLNRLPEAVDQYRSALRSKSDYGEAHCNLGNALLEMNQPAEAIGHFEAALRLDPNNMQAHLGLGNALCALGRAAEAIAHYEAIVRAVPDNPYFHQNLGSALFEGSDRIDEAISHFNAALRLKPDSAETHCNLGLVLMARGNQTDAIEHFEKAIRLRPDYAYARDQLAKARASQKP